MKSYDEDGKKAEQQAITEQKAQVESKIIYEGKKLGLRIDTITSSDGHTYKREIVVHSGAVVMLPVDNEGKIILVRQWRRAANRILIELPAGTLEKNEDPINCAQRELQEEIGFKAGQITPMGGFFSAPGILTEYLYLYLAEDLRESKLDPDENEKIDIIHKSVEEALSMIGNGEICDAKSVAGITRYYLKIKHGTF